MNFTPAPDDAVRRLDRWVTEHGRVIHGFLLGLVRRVDVADDLTQETFRRAWEASSSYRDDGKERSYLLRIADRLAVDYGRRSAHREITLDEQAWQRAEPEQKNFIAPLEQLVAAEQQGKLQVALESLSEMQRRVLLLRFFGDLEFAEIARHIGTPLGTVLSHCHRGLNQLRQCLSDERT